VKIEADSCINGTYLPDPQPAGEGINKHTKGAKTHIFSFTQVNATVITGTQIRFRIITQFFTFHKVIKTEIIARSHK